MINLYCKRAGYRGVVCFSCGNASAELKKVIDTIDVSVTGDLTANKWWDSAEIHRIWPHRFDATSGHLPAPLLDGLALAYRQEIGELTEKEYNVPTGSGETIICLALAYPDIKFNAIYDVGPGTEYNEQAPLNGLVRLVANKTLMVAPGG